MALSEAGWMPISLVPPSFDPEPFGGVVPLLQQKWRRGIVEKGVERGGCANIMMGGRRLS